MVKRIVRFFPVQGYRPSRPEIYMSACSLDDIAVIVKIYLRAYRSNSAIIF
jgi:hypothetical protein